eukprot:COSAG01_NODE_1805_length_9192_cov_13.807324_4_plen_169_part_00
MVVTIAPRRPRRPPRAVPPLQYVLQPIKLGSWGRANPSHKPLAPAAASGAPAPTSTAKGAKGAKGAAAVPTPRPLKKFRSFEQWVKRCLVRHATALARAHPGRDPTGASAGRVRGGAPQLTALDLACGRGAELDYFRQAGGAWRDWQPSPRPAAPSRAIAIDRGRSGA